MNFSIGSSSSWLLLDDDGAKSSDVVLRVGNKDFQAHKCILSARSPVFGAMFQHDMKEAKENHVDIEDVEVEVFEVMLRFIYTDKISSDDVTIDLLKAADKVCVCIDQCLQFYSIYPLYSL